MCDSLPHVSHSSATRWNCGRCGYAAMSSPYEDFVRDDDIEGTETHKCPVCGEQWWLDAATYSRESDSD
jgi:ribosomal protein S27AE